MWTFGLKPPVNHRNSFYIPSLQQRSHASRKSRSPNITIWLAMTSLIPFHLQKTLHLKEFVPWNDRTGHDAASLSPTIPICIYEELHMNSTDIFNMNTLKYNSHLTFHSTHMYGSCTEDMHWISYMLMYSCMWLLIELSTFMLILQPPDALIHFCHLYSHY